jgi:hypothetical protein
MSTASVTGVKKFWVTATDTGTFVLGIQGQTDPAAQYTLHFKQLIQVSKPVPDPAPGTYLEPVTVRLTTIPPDAIIYYTVDGGSEQIYTPAGIFINKNAILTAWAKKANLIDSDTLKAVYVITPPATVKAAWYKDADGDGRIDKAYVEFKQALIGPPAQLRFTLVDQAGAQHTVTATAAEIALEPGNLRVAVTFASPFPAGVTSVGAGSIGHTFKQLDAPLLEADFIMIDSVPPVIMKAEVFEADATYPSKRVVLTVSEPFGPIPLSQTAFLFSRDGKAFASTDIAITSIKGTANNVYTIEIDANSNMTPIPGDSVAIKPLGEVKDLLGNAPAIARFRVLEGKPPQPKPTDVTVVWSNESEKDPPDNVPEAYSGDKNIFVPVGKDGTPLATCNCGVGTNGHFAGPVFILDIPGAVDYEFQIYDKLGQFVAKGNGRIEEADLVRLETVAGKKKARIIWSGYTGKGRKAGTGAYILQSMLHTDMDKRTGAPASVQVKRVIFGLLRQFAG